MSLHLAIHHREGSFSHRWMEYCDEHGIKYRRVRCYDNDIIRQLSKVDALLWHWVHYVPADVLLAQGLIRAAEGMGLKIFPNSATCWHYDNKIAQKYLLEAVAAPIVPTRIFYLPSEALRSFEQTAFPQVFKLSKGAASANVRLVRNAKQARQLLRKAFGRGFIPIAAVASLFEKPGATFGHARRKGKLQMLASMVKLPKRIMEAYRQQLLAGRENGYLYLQEFMPDNLFDTRITIIGNRAFGFTRNVRPNDFRASGSGRINYDLKRIDPRCVTIALDLARKLQAQSIAFDFLKDSAGEPRINEISYCYDAKAVYDCEGHWDDQLNWKAGHMWPQDAILIDLLTQLQDQ